MKKDNLENDQFAVYRFRKWLDQSNDMPNIKMEESNIKINIENNNKEVFPRLGLKRLTSKIVEHNSFDNKLSLNIATLFKDNGGKIIQTDDLDVIIETKEYKFKIPKIYVKNVND